MSNALAILLEELIDTVQRLVDDEDQRQEIYDEVIQSFESAGLEDFSPVRNLDPNFDLVFEERYPDVMERDE